MRRKRALFWIVIAVALLIGGGSWMSSRLRKTRTSEPEAVKVIRRDFNAVVLATGAVKAQIGAEVRVGARISGKVEKLHTNIGDMVEKDQVIAELEKADLVAVANQRRAELSFAEKELVRQDDLLKQDFTTQQARDRVYAQREVAKAALENATVQVSYATITAPIDGAIASVSTQEGETVAAGLNAPTFVTIIDLDRLQVDAYVDEVDIGKIKIGQEAIFAVDAFPAREFKGKVVAVYPKAVIQENVVNYDVVVSIIGNYKGLLRPEMTASVTILLDTRSNVLALPTRALHRDRGRNVIYTETPSGPQAQEVKVGWRDGPWVEVLDGLSEGQTVLLKPPAGADERERDL